MEKTTALAALDFTSAPTPTKPLALLEGKLSLASGGWTLTLTQLHRFCCWEDWHTWLTHTEAVLGIDAPLGMPDAFLQYYNLTSYAAFVEWLCRHTKADWLETIKAYAMCHPPGKKQPKRLTDINAKALSPLMSVRVPVARMAYEAITRLDKHGWKTLPQQGTVWDQPLFKGKYVTEIYPAVLARQFTQSVYKHESGSNVQQTKNRQNILAQLTPWLARWGISSSISTPIYQAAVDDYRGDVLDALLGMLLLAWSVKHPELAFPRPDHTHIEQIRREGWIPCPIGE